VLCSNIIIANRDATCLCICVPCGQQNIEYETTLVAVSDLDCYFQALDSALQKFHALRIDEINKVRAE
jgi:hypothetical protein